MRLLITGACGFAGSALAEALLEAEPRLKVCGVDNFSRPGSEINRVRLKRLGVRLIHGDVRNASDVDALPPADWVIDAAANPSVLAGVDGQTSSRQLVEHNLLGTVNLLEYCRRHQAGFILLSTSRVYSIPALAHLSLKSARGAFVLNKTKKLPAGISPAGITEQFSVAPPISLYGATKLAAETLALEYGEVYGLPVWINRCGVLAGAGQFGRPDQGIFSYWIHSHRARRPLKYLGFGGHGHQVRDCLHPRDLVPLFRAQIRAGRGKGQPKVVNVAGGAASAISLRQLTDWCDERFGPHRVVADGTPRPHDLPWVVLDSALAKSTWGWAPATPTMAILEEIARHAEENPQWLELSAPLMISPPPNSAAPPLQLLSVVLPARDEEGCVAETVQHLHNELRAHDIPHEIIVVDDGSKDSTWKILQELRAQVPALAPVQNPGPHGFGRAIIYGLDRMRGDAAIIMMADESDSPKEAVKYWQLLNQGWDCVFGSRFLQPGSVTDYPKVKLAVNRLANLFIRLLFNIRLNDTTNAFKAYRRTVIDGCRPFLSPHFNLTVEIPLKAIVRGYSWTVMPITWRNRRTGEAKLKIKEMGSRYFFICAYVWLEKYFSRGDYKRDK